MSDKFLKRFRLAQLAPGLRAGFVIKKRGGLTDVAPAFVVRTAKVPRKEHYFSTDAGYLKAYVQAVDFYAGEYHISPERNSELINSYPHFNLFVEDLWCQLVINDFDVTKDEIRERLNLPPAMGWN